MPGHFRTNLGYTIPYDVFHFSFLNISIPKHYGTIEKCFQSHFETEFGHEKIDFMFFVCRDIMVAQEGLMTYLLSGKRYIQSAFLGNAISMSPIVEISIPDFVPSKTLFFHDPPLLSRRNKIAIHMTLPVQLNVKWYYLITLLFHELSSSGYVAKKITRKASGHTHWLWHLF